MTGGGMDAARITVVAAVVSGSIVVVCIIIIVLVVLTCRCRLRKSRRRRQEWLRQQYRAEVGRRIRIRYLGGPLFQRRVWTPADACGRGAELVRSRDGPQMTKSAFVRLQKSKATAASTILRGGGGERHGEGRKFTKQVTVKVR